VNNCQVMKSTVTIDNKVPLPGLEHSMVAIIVMHRLSVNSQKSALSVTFL